MHDKIDYQIGISPAMLTCEILGHDSLHMVNRSPHVFEEIRVTVSYYDAGARYLDFEEVAVDPIGAEEPTAVRLHLAPPGSAIAATIDISGQQQTFLKRHWKLICTVTAVIWGLIIIAKRLVP